MNPEKNILPPDRGEISHVYYARSTSHRRIPKTILLIVLIVVSIAASSALSSPKLFDGTINSLDDKKGTVTAITAGATAASAAITLIPGDVGTPIAEKFADVSEYTVFLLSAILLEKYLTTASGLIAFRFLIPIALLLLLLSLFTKNSSASLKSFGIKLILFSLILFAVVPTSVMLSNNIEKTYKNSTWEAAQKAENKADKDKASDSKDKGKESVMTGWLPSFDSKDTVENKIDEYKAKFNDMIDGLAVLIVTTCVLPILVFIFMIWVIKMIFGVTINLPKPPGKFRGAVSKIKSIT